MQPRSPRPVPSNDPPGIAYRGFSLQRSHGPLLYMIIKLAANQNRSQAAYKEKPFRSSHRGQDRWACSLIEARPGTLRAGINIALTCRTIPMNDHLLPHYVEPVLIGNGYPGLFNRRASVLDQVTLQADHVVVGTGYCVVPGQLRLSGSLSE